MNKKYHTLVISPHCDDEVLGCGGMLYNRRDVASYVYYLGIDDFHIIAREERLKEVKAVSELLGFDFDIGKNKVNNYKREEIINEITDVINALRPDEVFIPNPSQNQDHKEVYDASIIALRPHDKNHFVPRVFIYEVEQYLTWAPHEFEPTYFEPIDIEKKMAAYQLHASQVRPMRPPELLEKYAYIRGLSSKFNYAEGFVTKRWINSNMYWTVNYR